MVEFERSKAATAAGIARDLDSAISLVDEAIRINRTDAPMLTDAALLYGTRGGLRRSLNDDRSKADFVMAEELLKAALKSEPHPQIYVTWAAVERHRGDEDAAKRYDALAISLAKKLKLTNTPRPEK